MSAEKIAAVAKKAAALAGRDLGGDGLALAEMACQRALAECRREDIPEEMEQAVAALVLELSGEGGVKSLTRGDVSVTYAAAGGGAVSLLGPWRRLGTVGAARPPARAEGPGPCPAGEAVKPEDGT